MKCAGSALITMSALAGLIIRPLVWGCPLSLFVSFLFYSMGRIGKIPSECFDPVLSNYYSFYVSVSVSVCVGTRARGRDENACEISPALVLSRVVPSAKNSIISRESSIRSPARV